MPTDPSARASPATVPPLPVSCPGDPHETTPPSKDWRASDLPRTSSPGSHSLSKAWPPPDSRTTYPCFENPRRPAQRSARPPKPGSPSPLVRGRDALIAGCSPADSLPGSRPPPDSFPQDSPATSVHSRTLRDTRAHNADSSRSDVDRLPHPTLHRSSPLAQV